MKICLLSAVFITAILVQSSFAEEENNWSNWEEESKINISIVGSPVINLDLDNRLIRAYVDIINFDPSDGRYVMKIVQPITDKIISEKEIVIREKENDEAGTDVAYMINDDEIITNGTAVLGDYSIVIYSDKGSAVGMTTFSIVHPSLSKIISISEDSDFGDIPQTIDDFNETENIDEQIEDEQKMINIKKIPDWVKNIFILYADGSITENELISALSFLIDQKIIVIDQ